MTRRCGLLPGLGNAEQRMLARSVQDREAGHKPIRCGYKSTWLMNQPRSTDPVRRVFFCDFTREPLQYLIRSHF
jgi:hypothetical protein